MRLSVCFLFHRHSHIQFLCSPRNTNLEWLCSFCWSILVDPKSPSAFLSLLMCLWSHVKVHLPALFSTLIKNKNLPGEPWRVYGQDDDQTEVNFWLCCFLSALSHHANHTFSTHRFFFSPLIDHEYESLCTRLWNKMMCRTLVALLVQVKPV